MLKKLNNLLFGIVAGALLPVVIFFTLYFTRFYSIRAIEFPVKMILGELLPLVLSWCVIPDLLLFFIFNWADWLKAAKGVLISSVAITVVLFGLKFIFSWLNF